MDRDSPAAMDLARFTELADVYGSRLDRWPQNLRAAAVIIAATDEGRAILALPARLDALLDSYAIAPATHAVGERILMQAIQRKTVRGRLRRWWTGLGLAGVGLAGGLAGVLATSIVLSGPMPDEPGAGEQIVTVFGDVSEISGTMQEAQ